MKSIFPFVRKEVTLARFTIFSIAMVLPFAVQTKLPIFLDLLIRISSYWVVLLFVPALAGIIWGIINLKFGKISKTTLLCIGLNIGLLIIYLIFMKGVSEI